MRQRKRSPLAAMLREIRSTQPAMRRSELGLSLDAVVAKLIEDLGSESEQERRRFTVLRRSDVQREPHATIARDVGLSRSQFYRDLHAARERLTDALERAFEVRAAPRFL